MIPKLYTSAALPEPLDLFGQMLAQAPFAVWMSDREGQVFLFNEAMRNLVDIDDPSKVLGRYNIFKDPIAVAQGLVPYIKRVLEGQVIQTVVMMDLSQEDFGGKSAQEPKVFYVRCLYFPLKDDQGRFEYVVMTVENITQEYLEDITLSRTAHELEAANKDIIGREKRIVELKRRQKALQIQLAKLKGV
ncbi:MAG TPA: PAS domain-containing protein [Patescibacteria group bacterium]|nr:PAS domain-containing protein [Patescibacteria group bacterium]